MLHVHVQDCVLECCTLSELRSLFSEGCIFKLMMISDFVMQIFNFLQVRVTLTLKLDFVDID